MLGNLGRGWRERKDADSPRLARLSPSLARRWPRNADLLSVLGFFFLYLYSFGIQSPVHGPAEVFGNDSVQLLFSLSSGSRYPWSPQNHVLYHVLVEWGYRAWCLVAEPGYDSAFRYLNLFTALTGLGFLLAFRWLLCELGLGVKRRAIILALTGISVSAWFHFGAFETHALTMPWIALYLVSLLRLTRSAQPTTRDHALFVGSLVALGCTRVEGIRFALVSVVLLLLPGMRALRRPIARDLGIAVALFFATSAVLAVNYLDRPAASARNLTIMFERWDRPSLDARLRKVENLSPKNVLEVGRAISFYSIVMPIGDALDDPTRELSSQEERELGTSVDGGTSGWLFLQPLRNLAAYPISALALLGLTALLLATALRSIPRMARGDTFLIVLASQWLFGWLLYTWFNPFEPFLWALGFLPLTMAVVADVAPGKFRWYWPAAGVLAIAVALHNWQWFYLQFR